MLNPWTIEMMATEVAADREREVKRLRLAKLAQAGSARPRRSWRLPRRTPVGPPVAPCRPGDVMV